MQELPFRQIHLDFHTSPFIGSIGSAFSAEEFVQTLKAAHVNSINLFAKCHHGLSYYPTKVGRMHPGLDFDLLGQMIEVCHREGIKCPIYIPMAWEEVSAENANWLEVTRDGVLGEKPPFGDAWFTWRKICLNKEAYFQFVLAQVGEIMDRYEVDGFWFDIVFQHGCYCADCMAEMKRMGFDPKNEGDVARHDFIVTQRFMERLQKFVKDRLPDALTFFNYSLTPDNGSLPDYAMAEKLKFQTHFEIETLPSGEWGYNHFPLFSNYLNTFGKETLGMTGKFHKSWGDHGSLKNPEALEYECFRMLMAGSKCCIGDQLHPRGRLDPTVYKRIGAVYAQIMAREPWCAGDEKIANIGIFLNNRPLEMDLTSDKGAMRMLMELHQPFDFLDRRADFSQYELILFPDGVAFDGELAAKTKQYIEAGGKVILSNRSGLNPEGTAFALPEFGVAFGGENPWCPSYIRVGERLAGTHIEPLDYVVYEQGMKVAAQAGSEVLAGVGRPYFNRAWDHFSSHCQTAYEEQTGWPGIVRRGGCVYIAYPLFHNYMADGVRVYRDIVERCIGLLLDKPLIRTSLPKTAELAVRRQRNRTIVHMLHYVAQRKCDNLDIVEDKLPLYHIDLAVRLKTRPRQVVFAPSGEALPFAYEDGYVRITVPKLEGHGMVVVEE